MKYLNDVSYKDCVGKVCKSKSSGDIVEARPNTKFPEYQLLRWDDGVFGGVKTCTSMLVTEFELGNWIMLNTDKVSNVTIPCLIAGLCKMLVVIAVMIIICLLMAKIGE